MTSSKPTKVGSFHSQEKEKKMAIEKKTSGWIRCNSDPCTKEWISVEEIFRWAKEYPEDTFEDFLADIDYKRYLQYESE